MPDEQEEPAVLVRAECADFEPEVRLQNQSGGSAKWPRRGVCVRRGGRIKAFRTCGDAFSESQNSISCTREVSGCPRFRPAPSGCRTLLSLCDTTILFSGACDCHRVESRRQRR